jgi:hypothetical protein
MKIDERKKQAIYFSRRLRILKYLLQLQGRDIPFVNNVTCLGVPFDRRITRRHHIGRTVAKTLSKYIRTYSIFKSGCLHANIKFTLYRILIMSVMTYACPTWKFSAYAHQMKIQRLQNRVLGIMGNLDRYTTVRELHVVFKFPYVYDYTSKLCRTQAEIIINHVNSNVRDIGKKKPGMRSIRGLNLAAVRPMPIQLIAVSG